MTDNSTLDIVTCQILGEKFNLRCSKDKTKLLEDAVKQLQDKVSKMRKDNPGLSPLQASILTAIDAEKNLLEYIEAETPFINQATKKILKIKSEIKKIDNG